ncbi:MAG TPA: DUF3048 domain-containing protein [Candidatus Chromulinivoraceae bacterium]|nr:DUF3048 domain-containing protein [Candidatus Chromulinivoraceae bacterium]
MIEETKKHRLFKRVGDWIRHHRTTTYAISGAVLILIASGIAFALLNQKMPDPPKVTAAVHPKPKPVVPVVYYSPLTGNQVANQAATIQPVTAIMIENSPSARPQSGIKEAGVVFEAIAEGGITRYLTLHQEDKPQLIGPVRSVRSYYVDWLTPFNASVAHVGGSAAALATVRNGQYRDIDEFFNGAYYWRATDRYAPHNVYTSFAKLDALNVAKGYTESHFTGFTRTDGKAVAKPDATKIAIGFGSALYDTNYTYNPTTNNYNRILAGAPHLDREEGQITPAVVVAMKVQETTVLEDGYRENINAIGSGEAVIFQNGTAQTVTWHKATQASQITFTDTNGKDVPLVRGQTWIAAVPIGRGSVSWQ